MWVRWDPQILARMARTRSMPVVGAPHILKCSSSCHLWSCLGNHKVIREPKPPIKSWLYCNPFMVVYGMRLIRRPWKACQFWDVTFTIPWKGCKFQNEACANGGIGFDFFEFLTCYTCCRMIIRVGVEGGGEGCVWRFLTSTSFTLRKMHTLHMLSYDHQRGVGVKRGTSV